MVKIFNEKKKKKKKKKRLCTLSGTAVNYVLFCCRKKITYEHIFRVSNVYIFIPTQLKSCKMMTVSCKTESGAHAGSPKTMRTSAAGRPPPLYQLVSPLPCKTSFSLTFVFLKKGGARPFTFKSIRAFECC